MGRKLIGVIVALISFTAAGAYGGYTIAQERWQTAETAHLGSRSKAIISQAKQRDWKVVVLGDSMTELAMLNDVCGEQALNAGVSGAQVRQLIGLARDLSEVVRPDEFVIAVGTNDSRYRDPTSEADFNRSFHELIVAARATGARVSLLDIPPVGKFDKAALFDADLVAIHNRHIHSVGLPVGHVWRAMAGPDGMLPTPMTDDGVHPNARGYQPWHAELEHVACRPADIKQSTVE